MRLKPITSVILVQYSTNIELSNQLCSEFIKGIHNLLTSAHGTTGENEVLHPSLGHCHECSPTGWSKLTSLYPAGASKQVDSMTHLATITSADEPGTSSCAVGVSLLSSISLISALIAWTPATGNSPPPILPNVTFAFRTWNSGISTKMINHGVHVRRTMMGTLLKKRPLNLCFSSFGYIILMQSL